MRDNYYLRERLRFLWDKYFFDIPEAGSVTIQFSKKANKRLGSIREDKKMGQSLTQILINGRFANCLVPEYVIDATILHELSHYAHGFGSSLPRLSPFPHRGGAVDREMNKRGLGPLLATEKNWLDKNWFKLISEHKI